MKTMMGDEKLSLKQAQRMLKVSKRTLLQMVKCGDLKVDTTGQWISMKSCHFHSWQGKNAVDQSQSTQLNQLSAQERDMIADWT